MYLRLSGHRRLRLGLRRKLLYIPDHVGLVWVTPDSLSHSEGAEEEQAAMRKKHLEAFIKEQSARLEEFVGALDRLLGAGRHAQALAYYEKERPTLRGSDLEEIDQLMTQVRKLLKR